MPKLTVTINGHAFTRTTDRAYTHVVVVPARTTFEAALAKASDGEPWGRQWDRWAAVAAGTDPETISLSRPWAARCLAEAGSRETHVAGKVAYLVAQARKAEAKGLFGWQPVSWHRGVANATKGRAKAAQWTPAARVIPVGAEVRI